MFAERQCEDALCSIHLLSPDSKRLIYGAAPSLPAFYNRTMNGIEIGEGMVPCGTAAFTGRSERIEDVLTYPYWVCHRELAIRAGLRDLLVRTNLVRRRQGARYLCPVLSQAAYADPRRSDRTFEAPGAGLHFM